MKPPFLFAGKPGEAAVAAALIDADVAAFAESALGLELDTRQRELLGARGASRS